MKSYDELEKETLESNKELLEQYKKELNDLENHTGLAKCMSDNEIKYARKSLESSINSLEEIIKSIEK